MKKQIIFAVLFFTSLSQAMDATLRQDLASLINASSVVAVQINGINALNNNNEVQLRYWLSQDAIRAADRGDLTTLQRHIPVSGPASFEFGESENLFYCAMAFIAAVEKDNNLIINYFRSHQRFNEIKAKALGSVNEILSEPN